MKTRHSAAAAAAFLILVTHSHAEIVNIAIEHETNYGQSVFVGGPLPELGAGDITRTVRLSPHEYPVWQATFDLPPGLDFEPVFCVRNDDPALLANSSNGTQIPSDLRIQTAPITLPHHQVVFYASDETESVEAVLTSQDGTGERLSLDRTATIGGETVFTATIDWAYVHEGWSVQYEVGDSLVPDEPARLHGTPVQWRHGQGFLDGTPPVDPPSEPRRENFTFTPTDTRFPARTVRVLLPRGYNENAGRRYPVVYAEDGQNVFSPGGPFGSWDLDLITSDLIARGEIPEVIVVAIDHGGDNRIAEYIPNWGGYQSIIGRGTDYLEIVVTELLPFIDARYRTLTGPANTAHVGSSLGGLIGYEAANEFSDTFGAVVAMSPSFWINLPESVDRAGRPPSSRARLYIDSGTEGSTNDSYDDTGAVRDALLQSGHPFGKAFTHRVGLGHGHNEASWRARVPEALRWLLAPAVPAEPAQLGDANGDTRITPADAQAAFDCYLNAGACPFGTDAELANYCPDYAITPHDAQAIFETYLGVEEPCG